MINVKTFLPDIIVVIFQINTIEQNKVFKVDERLHHTRLGVSGIQRVNQEGRFSILASTTYYM